MSIANYSVVSRILAEVQQSSPQPELVGVDRVDEPQQTFELRRTRRVHLAPFATPFHFWAHALQALLANEGRSDLFEAMATHALCQVVEAEEVGPALAALAGRMTSRPALAPDGGFRRGYRMIDQDVMCSWVAEAQDEWFAAFWMRPDWLARAEPFDPEMEDAELEV